MGYSNTADLVFSLTLLTSLSLLFGFAAQQVQSFQFENKTFIFAVIAFSHKTIKLPRYRLLKTNPNRME